MVQVPEGGLTIAPTPVVIAPSKLNILPSRVTSAPIPTAPILANKVPFRLALAAIEIAPLAIKKTLEDFVPPVKFIVAPAPAVNAPPHFIIKKAFGLPPPSSVRVPPIDPAAGME